MNTILMLMTFLSFFAALSIHYSFQAFVSAILGDGSMSRSGRLNINPLKHIDVFGLSVAVVSAFPLGGAPVGLGWGKLVRPDAKNFRIDPNLGVVLVGLSGICINIATGVITAVILGVLPYSRPDSAANFCLNGFLDGGPLQTCLASWQNGAALRVEQFFFVFAAVNISVGLLNILPLFPLDGYHILFGLLPTNSALQYRHSEANQQLILLGILFLLPMLLQFIGFLFNPSELLFQLSATITALFTGPVGAFALRL